MTNNKYQEFISAFNDYLHDNDSVHAFWIEGSYATTNFDEYSDIDFWLSVDDEKIFSIYEDVKSVIGSISPVLFEHALKQEGELGHTVYWVNGLPFYNYIDVNTQKKSREIYLRRGIDNVEVIFDKSSIIKWADNKETIKQSKHTVNDLTAKYRVLSPQIYKNIQRKRFAEAQSYYLQLLDLYVAALREENGIFGKPEYGAKHMYDDLPGPKVDKVEQMYFASKEDINKYVTVIEKYLEKLS